jgi:hypothetical protein
VGASYEVFDGVVEFSFETGTETFITPFEPVLVWVDPLETICDATVDEVVSLAGPQVLDHLTQKYIQVNATTVQDSAWLQITHHYVPADYPEGTPTGIRLNNNRYWSLSGIGLTAGSLTLRYNGNVNNNGPDSTWITQTEDSLVVLWRPEGGAPWMVIPATRTPGNALDKVGTMVVNNFVANGDYALGIYDAAFVGAPDVAPEPSLGLSVFPNPAARAATLRFSQTGVRVVRLLSLTGQVVQQWDVAPTDPGLELELGNLPNGLYLLEAQQANGAYSHTRLLVQNP